ncbi:MAG: preprotein translocase subunit SecY [Armatimonadota bacterium]|nr:preprotein translocase subunit SecY [Armatimonadota bacterium]
MLASLLAAFRIPDLRKRILFVFGMFAVYVVGLHIPIPGIDRSVMENLIQNVQALGLLDIFTGGAFKRFTIFAMGITPYINASIIMQLLTIAIPELERLAKEGESGRKKISQYTRYLTGILAFVQAIGMDVMLSHAGAFTGTVGPSRLFMYFQIAITLTAGTAFLMWVGEQITDKGIGNGVSMVIFCGIMVSLPFQLSKTLELYHAHSIHIGNLFMLALFFVLTVAGIVAITQAQRKIPIQHVKRVVGNKVYGGQSSFLPLRVNSAGVIPIIFAVSIIYLPATIAQFFPNSDSLQEWTRWLSPADPDIWRRTVAGFFYALMIIFFTYFYTAVTFNVPDVAENLKKWGSFIPGIRPGKPTEQYLDKVMTRITLAGAIFLSIIALLQYWVPQLTGVSANAFSLVGGTSLLIVVGVALETMQAIESHLLMRHYEGFIK